MSEVRNDKIKHIHRLWPFIESDYKAGAIWLEEKERKGWRLSHVHRWLPLVTFEEMKTTEKCRYSTDLHLFPRVSFIMTDVEIDKKLGKWADYVELCEQTGWQCIGKVSNYVHIFQSKPGENPPPIHTNPEEEWSGVKPIIREKRGFPYLGAGAALLIMACILLALMDNILLFNSMILFFLLCVSYTSISLILGFYWVLLSYRKKPNLDKAHSPTDENCGLVAYRRRGFLMNLGYFITFILGASFFITALVEYNYSIINPFIVGAGILGGFLGIISRSNMKKKFVDRVTKPNERMEWYRKIGAYPRNLKGLCPAIFAVYMVVMAGVMFSYYYSYVPQISGSSVFVEEYSIGNYHDVDGLPTTRIDYCKGRSIWSADTIFGAWKKSDYQALEAIDLTGLPFDRGYYLDKQHSVAVLQKGNEVFRATIYFNDDTQMYPLEVLLKSGEFSDKFLFDAPSLI